MRELFTIRQTNFSGSFCEDGLKKLATALSGLHQQVQMNSLSYIILVVVDSIFRFTSGGDMEPAKDGADLFIVNSLKGIKAPR